MHGGMFNVPGSALRGHMIGVTMDAAKRGFFDTDRVIRATDAATRRVLSRFGAYVRQRARSSMRRRPGPSAPFSPPHRHVGLLYDLLMFGYDPATQGVVIGPTLLKGRLAATPPTVPELHEKGGVVVRPHRKRGWTQAVYQPRPYMGPAYGIELAKMPALWRYSIR